jgi:hypothetical protein
MIQERVALYRQLEAHRGRPLIAYVTSTRGNSAGLIASDAVAELLLQVEALPAGTEQLDFLIVSNGGDPTVAWRIVSLLRERVKKLSVLVPQAAYSAATLIALGADEIVMHPNGNLGPTDPQITAPKRGNKEGQNEAIPFGSEDLSGFLRFAREEVGLSDQTQLLSVFNHFCEEVGSVAVGVAARAAMLMVSMGEKLLKLHMTTDVGKQKAKSISQALTRDFFHHGYAVSRSEAKGIGLPIAASNETTERLMWDIWRSISEELRLREPFNALGVLSAAPTSAPLFGPVPQIALPANLPPQAQQAALQQALAQVPVLQIPPVDFENVHAVMESARLATRFVTRGQVFGSRQPDLQIKLSAVTKHQSWITVPLGGPPVGKTPHRRAPKKRK